MRPSRGEHDLCARLIGLLPRRPQMFWPMRRSILYFASLRLVIASSFGSKFEETRPPVLRENFPRPTGPAAKACKAAGPRVAKRFAGRKRPASRGLLGEKPSFCQREGTDFSNSASTSRHGPSQWPGLVRHINGECFQRFVATDPALRPEFGRRRTASMSGLAYAAVSR